MRKLISTALAAVLFGTAFIAPVSPAAAQTVQFYSSDRDYDDDRWRWRHRQGRDWDRRGDWDDRRYWRSRRDRDRDHDDFAAGILGFAAGALITGLAASSGSSHVARCDAHYRSYDPYTDTFLGYDGYRHQCRL